MWHPLPYNSETNVTLSIRNQLCVFLRFVTLTNISGCVKKIFVLFHEKCFFLLKYVFLCFDFSFQINIISTFESKRKFSTTSQGFILFKTRNQETKFLKLWMDERKMSTTTTKMTTSETTATTKTFATATTKS